MTRTRTGAYLAVTGVLGSCNATGADAEPGSKKTEVPRLQERSECREGESEEEGEEKRKGGVGFK